MEDETRPLLESQLAKPPPTPIPKGQLAALCIVRLVEPVAFTQLFPYVNEFMSDLHLTDDPSRVGFYSGLVVCCILVSAFDTSPSHPTGKCICSRPTYLHIPVGPSLWSVYPLPNRCSCAHPPLRRHRTSSRHPRGYIWHRGHDIGVWFVKIPCSSPHYPMHRSVPFLCPPSPSLLILTTGGISSGNTAVIHSVLGEITDASNQAAVVPIYGIIWPLGGIVGLVLALISNLK